MKSLVYLTGLVAMLAGSACSEPTIAISKTSVRRFEKAEWSTVYEAAHATMSEYFRIDEADRRTGIIRSVPTIVRASTDDLPLGKPLSSLRNVRKIAEIGVEPQGGTVVVRCGVLVQRAESVSHLAYAPRRTIDDTPNQTPLQESEGRDEVGNLVWNATGYDHKLERELLAAIVERQSPTPEP